MKQFNPIRLANVRLDLATIVGMAEIEGAIEVEREKFFSGFFASSENFYPSTELEDIN